MHLIQNAYRAIRNAGLHLRHRVFHNEADSQREWYEDEVFLRCQRCGLRSHGVQTGPPRLASRLSGKPARLRLKVSA